MAVSLIKTNRAYDILKNYNEENPYMLFLHKKVYVECRFKEKDYRCIDRTR